MDAALNELPDLHALLVTVEVFPEQTEAPHTHPGDEFVYLLEGQGTVLVDGEPSALAPSRAVLVLPGQVKAIRNLSDTRSLRVPAIQILRTDLAVVEFVEPQAEGSVAA